MADGIRYLNAKKTVGAKNFAAPSMQAVGDLVLSAISPRATADEVASQVNDLAYTSAGPEKRRSFFRTSSVFLRTECNVLRDIRRRPDRGWLFVAVALVALVSDVRGAGRVASEPVVRFTVFSAQAVVGLGYFSSEGTALCPIVFYPTTRSPRYDYRGTMPLRFNAADSTVVVAEVTIPRGLTDALLVFDPIAASAPGDLRYRVYVLDDGGERLPAGGVSIVNLSGLTLSGTIGDHPVTLKAGLNPAFSSGRSAKVMLRSIWKGRGYQAYTDTLDLKGNERALLILFPPYYPSSLETQSRLLIDEAKPVRR